MSDAQANEAEKNIEIWKVKKLIKRLEAARGNGTSMISLIIREYCYKGVRLSFI
jgi:peptide chain release factor subunit 1